MTKDEAFKEYEETMNKLDKEYNDARDKAKAILNEQLKVARASLQGRTSKA